MTDLNDADLMARFAAGDQKAVRTMYERYAKPVFTVALSALHKRDLADEALQATMLNAWRWASSYDPSRSLAPWLYGIARRVAVDIYHRENRAATPAEVGDDDVAIDSFSFERTWVAWEVRSALARLPTAEREVVYLSHLVGMTHSEIAEQLDVPPGTVKSRMARAYDRLAQYLVHVVGLSE